jgi:hypothetical protein
MDNHQHLILRERRTEQPWLHTALPKRRRTVVNKLSRAVGAMIEAQTPNTTERANVLP